MIKKNVEQKDKNQNITTPVESKAKADSKLITTDSNKGKIPAESSKIEKVSIESKPKADSNKGKIPTESSKIEKVSVESKEKSDSEEDPKITAFRRHLAKLIVKKIFD
ncbi:hypothetical protein GMMP13_470047 [Candidatus Magnetomoraceae bacterium gMMP-13]